MIIWSLVILKANKYRSIETVDTYSLSDQSKFRLNESLKLKTILTQKFKKENNE